MNGDALHLFLNVAHTKPVSDRRVEVHRFQRGLALLFGRTRVKRSHIVQSVGKLYDDDTDILAHRHKYLANILRLLLLLCVQRHLTYFRNAVHHKGNVPAETLFNIFKRGFGVLNDVVQQRRADSIGVHMIIQQYARDGKRVGDILLARGAHLPVVSRVRKLVSASYLVGVIAPVYLADLLHKIIYGYCFHSHTPF